MEKQDREKLLEEYQASEKPKHWKEEQFYDLVTPQKATLHLSRILYVGENADSEHPKRCLSVTKNGKSVAFDIEMGPATIAALEELFEGHIPTELKE